MEIVEIGPLPPAPAQAVQLCHPVIWSMFDLITAVEGGVGKLGVGDGVGVGVGLGVLPLTVIVSAVLKTVPAESHACTTTLCLVADMETEVSILELWMKYTLTLST